MTGLVINVTTLGHAKRRRSSTAAVRSRTTSSRITGNLGAAYMGLQLLEREKRVLADVENPEPQFKGYEYLLEKYLKPRPRTDIVRALAAKKIRPDVDDRPPDGLASDLMQICKSSTCGRAFYLERIPIARQTSALAEEMHTGPGRCGSERRRGLRTALHRAAFDAGADHAAGPCGTSSATSPPPPRAVTLVTPDGQDIKAEGTRVPGRISVLPPPAADGLFRT